MQDILGDDYLVTAVKVTTTQKEGSNVNLAGVTGSAVGQVPVWNGAAFDAGTIQSGNGISMGIEYAPVYGLRIGVNASQLRTTLGFGAVWNIAATAAPAVTDDSHLGYGVGSLWFDTTNQEIWGCLSGTLGAAVWKKLT